MSDERIAASNRLQAEPEQVERRAAIREITGELRGLAARLHEIASQLELDDDPPVPHRPRPD